MNTRGFAGTLIATVLCLILGVVVIAGAAPDDAKDRCLDTINKLYNDCRLQLGFGSTELDFTQAVDFCRNQDDMDLYLCWTRCVLNNDDCGEIAACIDGCYDGVTTCTFVVQIYYDNCNVKLFDPETEEDIERADALQQCRSVGGDLFDCYTNCAYDNFDDCSGLADCRRACAEGTADDDDSVDDDSADDDAADDDDGESIAAAKGNNLDTGGSACGM